MPSSDRKYVGQEESEREKLELIMRKKDWTQTEIGGSAKLSKIAGFEIRGGKRQMRYRHRNRHEEESE